MSIKNIELAQKLGIENITNSDKVQKAKIEDVTILYKVIDNEFKVIGMHTWNEQQSSQIMKHILPLGNNEIYDMMKMCRIIFYNPLYEKNEDAAIVTMTGYVLELGIVTNYLLGYKFFKTPFVPCIVLILYSDNYNIDERFDKNEPTYYKFYGDFETIFPNYRLRIFEDIDDISYDLRDIL